MSGLTLRESFRSIFYLIILVMLVLPASMPANAQVEHENPMSLTPSNPANIDDLMASMLGNMLSNIDVTSLYLKDHNFTQAKLSFNTINMSYDQYKRLLWQLNLSESDYTAISGDLDITKEQLYGFINDIDSYNSYRLQYNESLARGDGVNASIYADAIRGKYGNITSTYNDMRPRAISMAKILQNKDIDTSTMASSLNNFNDVMHWLSDDYNRLRLDNSSAVLELSANQTEVPVGHGVSFSASLKDTYGNPLISRDIYVYLDNRLVGNATTDQYGVGIVQCAIPANVSGDHVYAQAEYLPPGGSLTPVFSNNIELLVPDMNTNLSMDMDRSDASYGDAVDISGSLGSVDGRMAPGKVIDIYYNRSRVGSAVTDDNGSYSYKYTITSLTPAGQSMVYAAYERKQGDVFLNSTSAGRTLYVSPQNTILTLNGSDIYNLGGTARFNGKLVTENDIPVSGITVSLHVDGSIVARSSTDKNGSYVTAFTIPYDAIAGDHVVYSSFSPGPDMSLNMSLSNLTHVTFADSGEKLAMRRLPLAVFPGDSINFSGTLRTGDGLPMADRLLVINLSSMSVGPVKTDGQGAFNASYIVDGNEPAGLYPIIVSDTGAQAPGALFSGQVLLIPYDKFLVAGILVVVILIIAGAVGFIVLPRRREHKGDDSGLMPESAPAKPEAVPVPQAVPVKTFDAGETIRTIESAIGAGDLEGGIAQIYIASRKVAALHGVEVKDSMTHNEFMRAASKVLPSLSGPFRSIVTMYERAIYAQRHVSDQDVARALNSLKETLASLDVGGNAG